MALKLLETEFIKDAWFGKTHYQTRQTQPLIANTPGFGSGDVAFPSQIRWEAQTF